MKLALPDSVLRRLALLALVPFYVVAGINHFVNPDFYVAIMPPYLPAHLELVYLSGIAEFVLGIGVLIPAVRSLAGWGLVLLLVAVFPANLHMAMNPELFPDVPTAGLYGRIPIQFVFIAWAWWATRDEIA